MDRLSCRMCPRPTWSSRPIFRPVARRHMWRRCQCSCWHLQGLLSPSPSWFRLDGLEPAGHILFWWRTFLSKNTNIILFDRKKKLLKKKFCRVFACFLCEKKLLLNETISFGWMVTYVCRIKLLIHILILKSRLSVYIKETIHFKLLFVKRFYYFIFPWAVASSETRRWVRIYLECLLGVNLYKPRASNREGVHFI